LSHFVLLHVYFAVSLWLCKFVKADFTAVFVNKQHGIQLRGPHFDKTHKYTQHIQVCT